MFLVVLAVGIMPRDIQGLEKMLKVSRGNDRFLLEVHPKLRPVETAVNGYVRVGGGGSMTSQAKTLSRGELLKHCGRNMPNLSNARRHS